MMTPEEQAYVRKLEETIVKLEARIAELERRLNMNIRDFTVVRISMRCLIQTKLFISLS